MTRMYAMSVSIFVRTASEYCVLSADDADCSVSLVITVGSVIPVLSSSHGFCLSIISSDLFIAEWYVSSLIDHYTQNILVIN